MIVQGQLGDEMISVALLPSLASLVGHRVLYSTADEGSLEVTSLNSTVSRELNSTTTANCNCGSILSVLSTRLFNNNYKRWFLTGLPLSLSWENARTFWVTWHLLPKAQYNPGNWGADGNYECPAFECVGISTRWRLFSANLCMLYGFQCALIWATLDSSLSPENFSDALFLVSVGNWIKMLFHKNPSTFRRSARITLRPL